MVWPLVVGAALAVAGQVTGAIGSRKAAKAAKKIGNMNSDLIIYETKVNVGILRRQARQFAGTQRTLYAKGGVSVGEGSAYDTAIETQVLAEQAALQMQYQGDMRARIAREGGNAQATQYSYQAAAQLFQAGSTAFSAYGKMK